MTVTVGYVKSSSPREVLFPPPPRAVFSARRGLLGTFKNILMHFNFNNKLLRYFNEDFNPT
jgi:hypothetical protein